jgi:Xaa-Pro dipeptidase
MHRNPFDSAETARRLEAVRSAIAGRELDAVVLSSPENIFYLTGLDHWGYFAPHLLIVTQDRQPMLVTRAMERVTIENQVTAAGFRGHTDSETAADVAGDVLREMGLAEGRLGLESWSWGMSQGLASLLQSRVEAKWSDVTNMVDLIRQVKSPAEQELLRQAAAVADAATMSAIAAIHDGARERDVAAECLAAMTRAGGDPPGFGPFIRPASRFGEEHTTWGDGIYRTGESVFVELAGCVARYHAPNGRLVYLGPAPEADREIATVCERAFNAALAALRPGALARDVYAAWQREVDAAGLSHYRRHHCGYAVGIAFPPSWTGGPGVAGLRDDSEMEIREGMSFHLMSWLTDTGRGSFLITNCVLLSETGPEALTTTPHLIEV